MAKSATGDVRESHPRFTVDLHGHQQAETAFLNAVSSRRMHHAWLITGPRGVGKTTLAYRMARHLLRDDGSNRNVDAPSLFGETESPVASLEMAEDDPVFSRVAAGGHGNLLIVERGWDERKKAMRGAIIIDDVRKVHGFFTRTASEAGWRICIVDSCDEMNINAANALLKILEEPPEDSLLLLVSHAPGRLLPTIRSRCRTLPLTPLSDDEVMEVLNRRCPDLDKGDIAAIASLAEGAPGRALELARQDGLALYQTLLSLLQQMPGLNIPQAHALAGKMGLKSADDSYRIFAALLLEWVERMVRSSASGHVLYEVVPGEKDIRDRFAKALPLDRWGELWEKMNRLLAQADMAHLDKKQVILALLTMLDTASSGHMPA